MSDWPSRAEKLQQFKERILENVEVREDKGMIVLLEGGGSINFETMMDCFIRTRKFTLYKLMDRIQDEGKVDRDVVFKVVQQELDDIENEKNPT